MTLSREQAAREIAKKVFGTDPPIQGSAFVHQRDGKRVIEGFDEDGQQWVAVDNALSERPINKLLSFAITEHIALHEAQAEKDAYIRAFDNQSSVVLQHVAAYDALYTGSQHTEKRLLAEITRLRGELDTAKRTIDALRDALATELRAGEEK